MASIYHQIGIRAAIEDIFQAIATTQGITNWWTPTTGNTDIGGELLFHFGEHKVKMVVIESVNNQRVVWKNIDDNGQWKNTLFTFELKPRNNEVMLNFSQSNWQAVTEMFSHCSTKWAVFLLSLKDYLETGKGRPFPNDIHINHSDD